MSRAFVDYTGTRVGRLVAVRFAFVDARGDRRWVCRCDCGAETTVPWSQVKRGNTRSCGCLWREARQSKYGRKRDGTTTYQVWKGMKARCNGNSERSRRDYRDRGIVVCERWAISFAAFLADMGERPPGMSLDRVNNDGNYEPGNCRWATAVEQARNRRPRKRRSERTVQRYDQAEASQ